MYNVSTNRLDEIVAIGAALGAVATACVFHMILYGILPIPCYVIVLVGYFLGEFISTAKWQPDSVTSKSFLIYGNKGNLQFWLMQLVTVWEYFFVTSRWYGSPRRRWMVVTGSGILVATTGLIIRFIAMYQCGRLFNHHIQVRRQTYHKLVTTGVYGWARHPLYLGFWWFAVGGQILLHNWLMMVITMAVLSYFFTIRIRGEEYYLVHELYGDEYKNYKKRVGINIPLVQT